MFTESGGKITPPQTIASRSRAGTSTFFNNADTAADPSAIVSSSMRSVNALENGVLTPEMTTARRPLAGLNADLPTRLSSHQCAATDAQHLARDPARPGGRE